MSFSTKSSQDAPRDWMSLQVNVTFKTISLFETHDGDLICCPASNMHSIMRRFDCTTHCCLPPVQVDRSLCMTTLDSSKSSTTCAFCWRIAGGSCRDYTWRLFRPMSRNGRFGSISSSERSRCQRLQPGRRARAHTPDVWRHTQSPVEHDVRGLARRPGLATRP
jgi:hypothetical protein